MRIVYGDQVLPEVRSLVNDAARGTRLRLVSGYFQPQEQLGHCLVDALKRGVKVSLIVRGGRSKKKHDELLAEFDHPNLKVEYLSWLHAKLYLSDSQGIVTSMNLTENTAFNSGEIAACVRKNENPDGYRQMENAFTHFWDKARSLASESAEVSATSAVATRAPRSEKRGEDGHCIRCSGSVRLNPEKPLCRTCFDEWAEYENPEYKEKYCHQCGDESRTSMLKPLCRQCFAG